MESGSSAGAKLALLKCGERLKKRLYEGVVAEIDKGRLRARVHDSGFSFRPGEKYV